MESLLSALLAVGLIDAETADIIRRQENEEVARQWAEGALAAAAQGALSAQQQRLLSLLAESDYQPTERALGQFWQREDDLLWTAMRPQIEQVLTERATLAAVVGGQAGTFSLINQQVIRWAETYYTDPADTTYGSIPNLNLTSRQQVADAFTAWNRGELPGRPRGLPSLVEALTPTFGAVRAERIAVTESTRIFTESIRQAGLANKFTVAFRVLSSADDRVCPICGPVHGSVVAKTDERGFAHPVRGGIGFPPFHVRCRCGITEETEATLKIPLPPENQFVYGETTGATEQPTHESASLSSEKLLHEWVHGSNRRTSIILKEAIKQELGARGLVFSRRQFNISDAEIKAARTSVQQMYEQTQAYLKQQGIKDIVLYRGVKTEIRTPGVVESWSTDRRTANKFDGHDVMEMRVPAEQIFMFSGGPGWKNGKYGEQFEYMVMPGKNGQ